MKFHKLKIIEDVKEIVGCQNILFNILVDRADKEIHGRVFAGEPLEGDIYYISDLGLWYMYRFVPESRHWNAFGIDEPSEEKNLSIICE